jgi:hypothetical protein
MSVRVVAPSLRGPVETETEAVARAICRLHRLDPDGIAHGTYSMSDGGAVVSQIHRRFYEEYLAAAAAIHALDQFRATQDGRKDGATK